MTPPWEHPPPPPPPPPPPGATGGRGGGGGGGSGGGWRQWGYLAAVRVLREPAAAVVAFSTAFTEVKRGHWFVVDDGGKWKW